MESAEDRASSPRMNAGLPAANPFRSLTADMGPVRPPSLAIATACKCLQTLIPRLGYQLKMGAATDLFGRWAGGSFVKRQPKHLLTGLLFVTDLTNYGYSDNKTQSNFWY
jgi:hypothetical protein